ncbi:MAG TPA: hypothetical protein VFR86_30890 [Burkholderiaceae bacterium]|nr:hypothetical protein [Burkholderiaceae bacterium]
MSSKSIWVCIVLGVALFAVVVGTLGLGFWSGLLAVVLAICPLVIAWVVFKSRGVQEDIDAAARKT